MDPSDNPTEPLSRLAQLPHPAQWSLLLAASVILALLLELVLLPAAMLIGPLICGIVAGVNQLKVRVARPFFGAAQAVLGCLIATSISLSIFSTIAEEWVLVLGVVGATIMASSFRRLPDQPLAHPARHHRACGALHQARPAPWF
jgi:uncharacterized membrane protein AbrB (regulator of aidB expression)